MHAHDLLVNDSTNGHAVEHVAELLPHLDVVASLALIIETVDSSDRSTLMITSQLEEILRKLDLVSHQQSNGFKTLLATIDIITQEDVVALRWKAPILKESQQIMILTMDVTTDLNRSRQLQQGALLQKDLTSLRAKSFHLPFRHLYKLFAEAGYGLDMQSPSGGGGWI